VTEGVGVTDGVGESEIDGVAVTEGVGVAVGLGVTEIEGVGEVVGVAEGHVTGTPLVQQVALVMTFWLLTHRHDWHGPAVHVSPDGQNSKPQVDGRLAGVR
jgi:hypothetical protein